MDSTYQNAIDLQANVSELIDSIEACVREITPLMIKSKNDGGPLSESIEKFIKEMEDTKEPLRRLSSLIDGIKSDDDLALPVEVPGGSGGSNQETLTTVSELRNSIEACQRKKTDDTEKQGLFETVKETLTTWSPFLDTTNSEIARALPIEVPADSGGSNQETLTIVSELRNSIDAYERKIADFVKSKKESGSPNEGIEKLKKDLEDVKGRLNELTVTDSLSGDDSKKEKQENEKISDVLKILNSQFEKTRGEIDVALEVGSTVSGGKVKEEGSNEEI